MEIVKLEDIPEEKRAQIEAELKKVLEEPFEQFDENGLRYPVEHLNFMGPSIVILPLEYAARYVDAVTKTHIDNKDEEFIQLISTEFETITRTDEEYRGYNCTAIGNLAYVILNCHSDSIRERALEFYQHYADWYIKAIQNISDEDISKAAQFLSVDEEDVKTNLKNGFEKLETLYKK